MPVTDLALVGKFYRQQAIASISDQSHMYLATSAIIGVTGYDSPENFGFPNFTINAFCLGH